MPTPFPIFTCAGKVSKERMLLTGIKYAPEELGICSAPALFFPQLPGLVLPNLLPACQHSLPCLYSIFQQVLQGLPLYLTRSLPLTPNTLTVAQSSSLTFSKSLRSHSKHVVWESYSSTDEIGERQVHNSIVTQPEQQKTFLLMTTG